jgi:hypothetical protein
MGLLSFLFGKPQTLQDDYFGTLLFVDDKQPTKSYFEGQFIFEPTTKEIGLSIDADASGPTASQKEFAKKIQTNYQSVKEESAQLITHELREWMPGFTIQNFDLEFTPVSLTIPRLEGDRPVEWEIAYESVHDLNHTFTVTFADWRATSILVDG